MSVRGEAPDAYPRCDLIRAGRRGGPESDATAAYVAAFPALVRVEGAAFTVAGRSRRPPLECLNALLSFLHALLGHDCRSALESHGLDPQVGSLHADQPGRASLALDLMEELRPVLADRLALSLVNRRQLAASALMVEAAGGVRLADEARKRFLVAWQERKRDELRHPSLTRPCRSASSLMPRRRSWRGTCAAISTAIPRSSGRERPMLVVVAYDVNTTTPAGRTRLRRVARACLDYPQRVQNSIFGREVEPARWTALRARLVDLIAPEPVR